MQFVLMCGIVTYADVVQSVLRAHRHPRLLSALCRLFPLHFLTCLLTPPPPLLPLLEKAADEEPWVFGFSTVAASLSLFSLSLPSLSLPPPPLPLTIF